MIRQKTKTVFSIESTLTVSIGQSGDHEIPVRIEYTYLPGSPATPPSYSHGGLPPDPPEVEIRNIAVKEGNGWRDLPPWLLDMMQDDDSLFEQLCEHAGEQ